MDSSVAKSRKHYGVPTCVLQKSLAHGDDAHYRIMKDKGGLAEEELGMQRK